MPDNAPVSDEIAYQIDFNFHQVPSALDVAIPDEAAALMLKIGPAAFKDYVASANAEVRKTAQVMLQKRELADAVRKIKTVHTNPVSAVLSVGDSITTYRYGHAELLRAMMELTDPAVPFLLTNVGRSGYTSTHGLEHTYTIYLPQNPDWVTIKYGVNDTKRFGGPEAKTLVSLDEYRANMDAIVGGFTRHTKARVLLLTPTPVLEDVVNNNPDFIAYHMVWHNSDLENFAAELHDIAHKYRVELVDLFSVFTRNPKPELLLADGLHPSQLGQQIIVEQVLHAVSNLL